MSLASRLEHEAEKMAVSTIYSHLAPILREAAKELRAKQAEIDRLMLEYCPEEMSPEQIVEWARHQRPVHEPYDLGPE